jgi:GMP synthase-like glutamine amidotransferase
MQPVLILQNLSADGPSYLSTWLRTRGVPFEVRDTQAGDVYPDQIGGYRALALMGGEMSANDPLPSLRRAERLVQQAMQAGVPVIGHCLGGQLIARALGARIVESPAPEIGWQTMQVLDEPLARAWLGDEPTHTVMHWHSEAFELPPGATALATSAACPVQAFALGPHLGMQFHIEIDEAKLARWAASTDPAYLALQQHQPTVQSGPAMRAGVAQHLAAHQRLADRVYGRWLAAAR